ncbi:hypothetical protein ZOSMA_179G00300 [Zostera marina]|uniref:FLZ-type domain-containing protein n=1 Tax=Zostera marina TaxID=29655 RepID=A0A0K9PTQ3_ZOSMR|nr:hypothetical protein ZOSMA_179G00300 [Zostera marina]
MMGLRVVLEVQTNKTHHILSKSSMINNKPASQRSSRIHRRSNSDNAFLDECYLCRRNLLHHQDIYMCRDKAFCSERCRFKLLMIEDSRRR